MENYIFDKPQKAFSIKAHDDDICLKVFRLQTFPFTLFSVIVTITHGQLIFPGLTKLHVVGTLFQIHTYF